MDMHLERIDPERNLWRWYHLSVQPTLFGDWMLLRQWGRIGNRHGQARMTFFDDEADARLALSAFAARKHRRGYAQSPLTRD